MLMDEFRIENQRVKLLDIIEKVTIFNVTRMLEQNSSESPIRRGQRTIYAFFTTMFVGGVDELLHKMQDSFRN
ncbi:hypothetical protein H5410_007287 [Solanum commersonii]|uniref:Uncharacterized protein n=1 Tax=Solanum commersonii TaxID=4109 RepID=A0A9J6ABN8_SOLCO|nr:hypothetical protein H5410_007287 [Solanum commersonii]